MKKTYREEVLAALKDTLNGEITVHIVDGLLIITIINCFYYQETLPMLPVWDVVNRITNDLIYIIFKKC